MHLALDEVLALLELGFVISNPRVLSVKAVLLFDLPGPDSPLHCRVVEGMLVLGDRIPRDKGENCFSKGHDESDAW
jgi:hypothetical protein